MKHEAERKHEDKKEEVFIDTGTELKYLTERKRYGISEYSETISNLGT